MIDKFANDGPLGQNDGPFAWQIGQGRESADKSLYISKYYLAPPEFGNARPSELDRFAIVKIGRGGKGGKPKLTKGIDSFKSQLLQVSENGSRGPDSKI